MKAIDIFCASHPAITTTTTTTTTMVSDNIHPQPSSSSASNGGRAIDRHNPLIQHQKRLTTTTILPPPLPPPQHHNNKKLKNPDPQKRKTKTKTKTKTSGFADENKDEQSIVTNKDNHHVVRRQGGVLLGWGCSRPGDFISPANSSRFLLADKALSDQFDPLLKQTSPPQPAPPPPPPVKAYVSDDDHKSFKKDVIEASLSSSSPVVKMPPRSSSSSSSRSSDQQVVVLRVSLHCRGCEKKMRKHISKMEGVTSFNIDFMAKKVTVVGDVTPLAVLTSVSKVKNAKLLTPTTISAPPVPHSGSNISEIKKQLGVVA